MPDATIVDTDQTTKANMDNIYIQPDPRSYFRELRKVDYRIPELARPILRGLACRLNERTGETVHTLDIGCSYGINAALMKHDVPMAQLYEHWTDEALAGATADEIVAVDRAYFGTMANDCDIAMIGLDQSEPAIAYAEEVGLLDKGLAIDLEQRPLPADAAEAMAAVDLIVSTGAVGYVTEKTFDKILPAVKRDRAPWIANFVLRMFPFDAIEQHLAERGYVTEKLEGRTFVQREFVSRGEQERVIENLADIGIDPTGLEAEGHYHAEFFLSRPREDADIPIETLLAA